MRQVASAAKAHLDEAVERAEGALDRASEASTAGRALQLDRPQIRRELRGLFLPAVGCGSYLARLERADFDVFHPSLARGTWATAPLLHEVKLRYALARGL